MPRLNATGEFELSREILKSGKSRNITEIL